MAKGQTKTKTQTWQIDTNDVTEPVIKFFNDIVKVYYPLLTQVKFGFFFIEKAKYLGKTQLANATMKAATDLDVIITLNFEKWENELDSNQRKALVHWCIEHIEEEEDKETAEIKLKLQKPLIMDFPAVVAIYGAWQPEIVEFAKSLNQNMFGANNSSDEPPLSGGWTSDQAQPVEEA